MGVHKLLMLVLVALFFLLSISSVLNNRWEMLKLCQVC